MANLFTFKLPDADNPQAVEVLLDKLFSAWPHPATIKSCGRITDESGMAYVSIDSSPFLPDVHWPEETLERLGVLPT